MIVRVLMRTENPIRGAKRQERRSAAGSLLGLLLAGSMAAAHADHRPFGVLPEGNLRLDSPADYDSIVPIAGGRFVVEGGFGRVDGRRVAGPVILDRSGRLVREIPVRCAGAVVVPGLRRCRLSVVALPDGGFAVGGAFDEIDGEAIAGIARFGADGSLDTNFRPVATVTAGQAVTLVGVALGHLYYRASGIFRRVPLAAPHVIDPAYAIQHDDPVFTLAPDGRLFAVGRLAGMYMGIIRWSPDGSPAGTIQGVPEPTSLWFDPGTDRLFAVTRIAGGDAAAAFTRIDPATGPEPGWQLERAASMDPDASRIDPRALDGGRIIVEQRFGASRWLTVNAASNGNLIAAVPLPVASNAAYFGDGAGGWIAAPPRLFRVGMAGGSLGTGAPVRLNAALSIDPSFATDVHAIGAAFTSTLASGGGFFIGGEFGAVEGVRHQRLARLDAGWNVDQDWRVAEAAQPQFPIFNVGHTSDGILVAGEFHSLIPFLGVPSPQLILAAGSGDIAQRRWVSQSPFRSIVFGEHVYGSQLCPWPPDQQQPLPAIWRVPVAPLMSASPPFFSECAFDFTWQVAENAFRLAATPDGWIYFYSSDPAGGTIRRIRPVSGAVPDPAMVIHLPPPVVGSNLAQVFSLAVTSAHVYVSRRTQPDGGGELIRYRTSDGSLDPTWSAVPLVDVTGALAADADWLYHWDRLPEGPPPARPWALYRRSAGSGAVGGPLRVLESLLPTDSGHPQPSVTAIGDGRAIATWRFVALDGVPRDGFAVVGSVESMLADGFEAR